MKVLIRIDPYSTAKVAAILGILWSVLGWFFSGLMIKILTIGAPPEALADTQAIFSLGGLMSGIIGGVIGGAVSGLLGSMVYNSIAKRSGGIKMDIVEVTVKPMQ